MKKYRIGDFSRYLGVSSDYLKHYEKNGLLEVHPSESGYRYYSFDQSARVIEYLRLRNYGVSIKDMQALWEKTPTEATATLDARVEEISAEIARLKSIVDEHRRFQAWQKERILRPIDWEITTVEPYYFLFHTHTTDFLKEPAIYELLNKWLSWLPVTKSALYVKQGSAPLPTELFWGLAISESMMKEYALPTNDAVIKLAFEKAFVFHFWGLEGAFGMKAILLGKHPAFDKLRELGFTPSGDSLLLNEMRLSDEEGQARNCIGRFLIPIRTKD